jgi:hypothetical protein
MMLFPAVSLDVWVTLVDSASIISHSVEQEVSSVSSVSLKQL